MAVRGRLAGVIAVAKPDRDQNLGLNTLESALLETGRPVLLCPPGRHDVIGRHVALAWNGSKEACRAVFACRPVLQKADRVSLLVPEDQSDLDIGSSEILRFLEDQGIQAVETILQSTNGRIGTRILVSAEGVGADLIVMGAYGRSRGREMVLGGATQAVIDRTALPVLMVH